MGYSLDKHIAGKHALGKKKTNSKQTTVQFLDILITHQIKAKLNVYKTKLRYIEHKGDITRDD